MEHGIKIFKAEIFRPHIIIPITGKQRPAKCLKGLRRMKPLGVNALPKIEISTPLIQRRPLIQTLLKHPGCFGKQTFMDHLGHVRRVGKSIIPFTLKYPACFMLPPVIIRLAGRPFFQIVIIIAKILVRRFVKGKGNLHQRPVVIVAHDKLITNVLHTSK